MSKMKIMLAMPSHEMVPASFMYDFVQMVGYTVSTLVNEGMADIAPTLAQGTYVHSARQELALSALEDGSTHVLWVDTDMRFPKDALLQLLRRNVDMVGINYSTRGFPPKFVAIKSMGLEEGGVARKLITNDESSGMEEAEAVGFGLVLMRTSVIRKVAHDLPIFWFKWLPGNRQMGEDVYFCEKVRAKGVRVYVDHDLSKQCGHMGQFEFKPAHAEAMLEAQAA